MLEFAKNVIPILDRSFVLHDEFFDREDTYVPYESDITTMCYGSSEQGFKIKVEGEYEPKYGGRVVDRVLVTAYGLPEGMVFELESTRKAHDPAFLEMRLSSQQEEAITKIAKAFDDTFRHDPPFTEEELELELLCLKAALKHRAWSAAKQRAKRILRDFPNNPQALFALGVVLGVNEDFSKARTILEQVVSLDPNHYDAWYNLGIACYKQGDYKEA
ncbi:MAG: tetratricopeptide repeat protein [Candidatus Heimdallarchaeota archaeon]|nr:tetratricopeptide repeat protein [Candidatus Heimdallarchaeota archaeon]